MVTPPKREGSDRGTQCREAYHVLTDMLIVLLMLALCQVVLTPRQSPDISHKTTAAWAARVAEERALGHTVGFFDVKQNLLGECTRKLVERVPLTVWETVFLKAQTTYVSHTNLFPRTDRVPRVATPLKTHAVVQLAWDRSGSVDTGQEELEVRQGSADGAWDEDVRVRDRDPLPETGSASPSNRGG